MANRVGQIHASTNPQNWKYVPTKENPADIVSRGASVTQIVNNEYWWNGPECLSKAEEDWPKNKVEKIILEEIEQKSVNKNKNKNSAFSKREPVMWKKGEDWRLLPDRFSSWIKYLRFYVWVYRFLVNCSNNKANRQTGELTKSEIQDVEDLVISQAQHNCFSEDIM